MTQAGSQAWAFYREVARSRVVWCIRDVGGIPAPKGDGGKRTLPLWSSRSRAERIIKNVPAYAGFEPFAISWDEFCERWVPGMTKDGLHAGINWSGKRALGYDIEPQSLQKNVEAVIENPQ